MTTSSDSARLAMSPGDIESESPVRAPEPSSGIPQSGPPGLGNNTNSAAATGIACRSSTAA